MSKNTVITTEGFSCNSYSCRGNGSIYWSDKDITREKKSLPKQTAPTDGRERVCKVVVLFFFLRSLPEVSVESLD